MDKVSPISKLIKYVPPTKMDLAPFGTLYHVFIENGSPHDIYIQLSNDEPLPHWESIGSFLTQVFHKDIADQTFIDTCLGRYLQDKQ